MSLTFRVLWTHSGPLLGVFPKTLLLSYSQMGKSVIKSIGYSSLGGHSFFTVCSKEIVCLQNGGFPTKFQRNGPNRRRTKFREHAHYKNRPWERLELYSSLIKLTQGFCEVWLAPCATKVATAPWMLQEWFRKPTRRKWGSQAFGEGARNWFQTPLCMQMRYTTPLKGGFRN